MKKTISLILVAVSLLLLPSCSADISYDEAEVKELFSGVMVFNSRSLFNILPKVGCANVQKEYYITEVPELMVRNGMQVETYFTKDGDDLRGINTPEDLEICEHILEKRMVSAVR